MLLRISLRGWPFLTLLTGVLTEVSVSAPAIFPAVIVVFTGSIALLADATIHVDPEPSSGEDHHRIENHEHDDLPAHSH